MKIDRISYGESHEGEAAFGLRWWKKIGMEATIDETDNPEASLEILKEKVQAKLRNPELIPIAEALQGVLPQTPIDKRIGVFAEDIESCKDIKTLETYKYLIKNPALKTAYEKRLKELSHE